MLQDFRYGVRMLLKSPGFTAVAVLALALGIGANTAIFSLVNAVLLHPLPYRDPDRLVMVWEEASFVGFPRNTPAPGNYIDWKKQNQVFEDMAAMRSRTLDLTGTGSHAGDPEQLFGLGATYNFFSVLGVKPALGRVFLQDEDRPEANHVAVISYGLWQRRFGGDPKLVGDTIQLNGEKFTVVGVMPADFQFGPKGNDFWVPMAFTARDLANRGSHYLTVVARLKPGVTLERAWAEMTTIAKRLEHDYPNNNKDLGAVVVPLREQFVGETRTALLVLLAAVGCVLLIACANIANLLLARAAGRRKEIAVRTALGAGRTRIVRQLVTESVLLAGLGGAAGLLLSLWSFHFLAKLIPDSLANTTAVSVDLRVLGFALLVSLLTGVIFGIAPAVQASRLDLNEALKQGGGRAGGLGHGRGLRNALVVSEVALALVLLVGAGLLIQTLAKVRGLDPGFRAENVLTLRTTLPHPKYADFSKRAAFFEQVLERVKGLPGVVSAGYTSFLPLTCRGCTNGFDIEGRLYRPGGPVQDANIRVITLEYLQTLRVPLRRGRLFDEHDGPQALPVVIINEAMARKFWPNEDPLGKRIHISDSKATWRTIVGIVGDVRQMGLEMPGRQEMYEPLAQTEESWAVPQDLAIRTRKDPLRLAAAVRHEIQAVDPEQPVANVRTMEEILDAEVSQRSVQMTLLEAFAGLALLLASVGIYGVLSYAVAQRTQEIGVRMALGAEPWDVLRMVVGQGLALALLGAAIGLAAAFALTRVIASLLYGVSATDPATFLTVPVLLIAVALAASYIPARRATKVDPMAALRYE